LIQVVILFLTLTEISELYAIENTAD
jgi:hypothetical protein